MFKYFGLVHVTSEVQSCDHSQQPKHARPHLCIRFFFWAEKVFTKQRREWMDGKSF